MFNNLIYLPIDVNYEFDLNKILSWHIKFRYLSGTKSRITSEIGFPWWISQPLVDKDPSTTKFLGQGEWNIEFLELFPDFRTCVEELPFDYIKNVSILQQHSEVLLHKDLSKNPEPCAEPASYRYLIVDEHSDNWKNQSESFYFQRQDLRGKPDGESLFPRLPQSTRWWLINNHLAFHGSKFNPSNTKLILSIWGKVNTSGHLKLLELSYAKYSDYALFASKK